MHKKWKSG